MTRQERDLADCLIRLPHELTFADEEPAAIVDRYYSPDFEQLNDGILLNRDRLIQHARPARRNVAALRTDVHDVIIAADGDRFAARYTLHARMRRGAVIVTEVSMFGRFAPDGRIRRIDSTTRTVTGEETQE